MFKLVLPMFLASFYIMLIVYNTLKVYRQYVTFVDFGKTIDVISVNKLKLEPPIDFICRFWA